MNSISTLGVKPFIYGSCVTRDAFEFLDGDSIAQYLARSPVISAMSDPILTLPDGMDISKNASAFQRRMVTWDVQKALPTLLAETKHDTVVIDLIDERLRVLELGTNQFLTFSPEAAKTGVTLRAGKVHNVTDTDFLPLWDSAAKRLITLLRSERVILNKVFWASQDQDGNELNPKFNVRVNNQVLMHMYTLIEEGLGCQVIEYPNDVMRASSEHRWGLSPFHFIDGFYHHFLRSMKSLQ